MLLPHIRDGRLGESFCSAGLISTKNAKRQAERVLY